MTDQGRIARCAGLVYLVVVVTGFFSQGYVPGKIAAPGDPEALLANIMSHEMLFRAGIAVFMVEQVTFLLLPFLLFRLLQAVQRSAAVAMVLLAVVGVPISLVAVGHHLDALQFLTQAPGISVDMAHALARLSLKSYDADVLVASVFWGLWLIPFGYLVIKCGRLPRVLGVLLMLGGAGYLVDISGELLLPGYAHIAFFDYVHLPAAFGEVGICLWLLLMGIRSGGGEASFLAPGEQSPAGSAT